MSSEEVKSIAPKRKSHAAYPLSDLHKNQTEQEEGEERTKNLKRSTNEQITSSERKRLIKCLERRKVSSAST